MNSNRGNAATAMAVIKPQDGTVLPVGELMERIIAAGDISQLSAGDRAHFMVRVCESVGLNPLSQPFDLIPGPGGTRKLYMNKSGTDQLRKMYRLHTVTRSAQAFNDTYIVTVEVSDGRRSESNIGAVTIDGLKGEALANALMKCHTKAKRRATLDWCGLGVLDEAEIEDLREMGFVRAAPDLPATEAHVLQPDVRGPLVDLDDEPDIGESNTDLPVNLEAERRNLWAEAQELGYDWAHFNKVRREKKLPTLEQMDLQHIEEMYEALLDHPTRPEIDVRNDPERIDFIETAVSGEPGFDRHTG